MAKIHPFVQWWLTPKYQIKHLETAKKNREKFGMGSVEFYVKNLFIHPIKRRAAKFYLRALQILFGLEVIGITGSLGKTTTKNMMRSILEQLGKTNSTVDSVDPVYNIPTTILRTKPGTKYLILEMSVEFPGEMDYYLWLARPEVGLITNIFPTHTEFFGSPKGVAKEKVKLVSSLKTTDIAVLNKKNSFTKTFNNKTKAKVLWYGFDSSINARNIKLTKDLKTQFTLIVDSKKMKIKIDSPSPEYINNTLAAAAVGRYFGADLKMIKKGLETFRLAKHRVNLKALSQNNLLIDDTYSSNPEAAKTALRVLNIVSGKRIKVVVFGDMLELGESEVRYHNELGNYIAKSGVDYLIGVGNASRTTVRAFNNENKDGKSVWVEDQSQVDKILKPHIEKNTAILIKGSRSIRLDKLVERLFEK